MQDNDPTGPALDESQATVPVAYSLDELMQLPVTVLPALDERPSEESLREKPQVYFEDVEVGLELPRDIQRLTPAQLVRWASVMEDWDSSYFDLDAAVNRHGLPGVVVPDSWKVNAMCRLLKDWALPGGWLWKLDLQHKALITPREVIVLWGKVTQTRRLQNMGLVNIESGILVYGGTETMPSTACVALPLRSGPPLPYPFIPPEVPDHAEDTPVERKDDGESLRSRWKKRNQHDPVYGDSKCPRPD